ncbi:MAG: hypothetical protein ACXAC7_13445, partial [Candidatus Hodarchaeales archaeon]
MALDEQLETSESIVSEFKQKFASHRVRIERFRITQRGRISRVSRDLLEKGYSEEDSFLYSLIYAYLVSEDLTNTSIDVFIEDFKLIAKEFGFPIGESTVDRIIEKVVTPFIQIMYFQKEINFELSKYLIQRISQLWPESLTRSYTLNDFFKPLMVTMKDQLPNVKLRFLGTLAWVTLERYTEKNNEEMANKTINDYYEVVKQEYPDLNKKVFCFDFALLFLLEKNWPNLMALVQPEVDKLRKQFELDRERMRKEQKAREKAKERKSDPIAEAQGRVSLKIYELFHFKQDFSTDKEYAIEKGFSLLLRRMALDIWGHVAAESVEPIRERVEEFIWPEIKIYPVIVSRNIYVKSKFYVPNAKSHQEIYEELASDPA